MARPMQVVKIYGVQDRRSNAQAKLPWVVRYTIDGRHRSKSFRTRIEADRYRGTLLQAVQDGGRFDETSGEPEAWHTPLADMRVHEWSRRWLGDQWQEWQPRTRASATEALARFITIAIERGAQPPEGLRVYLYTELVPGADPGLDVQFERWMAKHCLTLAELDRDRIADIDRKLGLKLDGSQLAANTANRIRIVARASVQSAIDAGAVAVDAWPQRSKTRARRKVARTRRSVDVRTLPSPAVMAVAIDAIATHQPASNTYRVMTAVAYYGGLRPSEVVMLRVRSAHLPGTGWVVSMSPKQTSPSMSPANLRPDRAVSPSRQCSSPSCKSGSTPTTSPRPNGCCSGPGTTTVQADRTGHAPGTVHSCQSVKDRYASTTADMPPPPPGYAPACPSPKQPAASATASNRSSPHTSAPSTTKNTPPTNASTSISNQHTARITPRPRPIEMQRNVTSAE